MGALGSKPIHTGCVILLDFQSIYSAFRLLYLGFSLHLLSLFVFLMSKFMCEGTPGSYRF